MRQPGDERIMVSEVFDVGPGGRRDDTAMPRETWREPGRELPVHARCQVLVAGGGPSGTAAAVSAARAGADVILLERYNHLGGLATGGLVIWIDRMTDWEGRLVIRGFAEEILGRLPADAVAGPPPARWGSKDPALVAHWAPRTAGFRDTVTWSPTIDPERLKLASQALVLESGVRLVHHAWAVLPVVESGRVRGVVFESKAGRRVILAEVVVDATGDGDLFARAGAGFEQDIAADDIHHCMNTAWLYGGVDMARWLAFRADEPKFSAFMALGRKTLGLFDKPFVSWRDDIALFMGPRQAGWSPLEPEDQTAVEIRSRELMTAMLDFYRAHAPGFERAYLLQSAPQLGVRHSRRLLGTGRVARADWPRGTPFADEIGVSPSLSPVFPVISVPYGALVPRSLDGLLACGRHVACDPASHGFMREIPQCWVTGQAAGVAAAIAARDGIAPRAVPVAELRAKLIAQGAWLRAPAASMDAEVLSNPAIRSG